MVFFEKTRPLILVRGTMSLLLKAFPHGRPHLRARTGLVPALVLALAMSAVVVPLSATAGATSVPTSVQASVHAAKKKPAKKKPAKHPVKHHQTKHPQTKHKAVAKKKPTKRPRAHAAAPVVGRPVRNYVMPATSYFSFPNRSKAERMAIRNKVLFMIQSVWGGPRNSLGQPARGNGTIRIATWSFDDWDVAKALVAAHKRGVSVQVVAAKTANQGHASWEWLRKRLGQKLYVPGHTTVDTSSFARVCRGACRGPGGTPHSKYFLFDNVGLGHARKVVVQTSMNLTWMAYWGQWNQAQVIHSYRVYDDYLYIYRQSRLGHPLSKPYHVSAIGPYVDYFFPRPQATAAQDPVMQNLNAVNCTGSKVGSGSGHTMVRVIQYAIYGDRGVWIAKKLRALWNAGCDVAIIYSVSSRPVLTILRNRAGRGAVPMKQSVVTDGWGNIVKYNHSKWMTIAGHFNTNPAAYVTFNGSANWANLAFGDDEQMQRISSRTEALRHLATFVKTWKQKTSVAPTAGGTVAFGRSVGGAAPGDLDGDLSGVEEEPTFGQGVYRYLPED
jgi:hypothetical protein